MKKKNNIGITTRVLGGFMSILGFSGCDALKKVRICKNEIISFFQIIVITLGGLIIIPLFCQKQQKH